MDNFAIWHRGEDRPVEDGMSESQFKVGDRVKHSQEVLCPLWERYLGLGDYTRKNQAKQWHADKAAEMGTVVEVQAPPGPEAGFNRRVCWAVKVRWDSGSVSECLEGRVQKA